MKAPLFSVLTSVAALFATTGFLSLPAQNPPPDSAPLLSPSDLEELVAPIALYPDPMVALILPASTVPTDVVLAHRYVEDGKDVNNIDNQNWDDSVKGLARYPDVLKMMDDNLDWTNQLGAAVLAQKDDVMSAIQDQRAKASSLGNLQTTPQQQVIVQDRAIQIVPADPRVIYVPTYDPQVVYVDRSPNIISFGAGFAAGAWISGGFDWRNHGMYYRDYYRPNDGWRRNDVNININIINRNVWRPNPHKPRPRPVYNPNRPGENKGGIPVIRPPKGDKDRPNGLKPNKPAKPDATDKTKDISKPDKKDRPNRVKPDATDTTPDATKPDKKAKPDNVKPAKPGDAGQTNGKSREDRIAARKAREAAANNVAPTPNNSALTPADKPSREDRIAARKAREAAANNAAPGANGSGSALSDKPAKQPKVKPTLDRDIKPAAPKPQQQPTFNQPTPKAQVAPAPAPAAPKPAAAPKVKPPAAPAPSPATADTTPAKKDKKKDQ